MRQPNRSANLGRQRHAQNRRRKSRPWRSTRWPGLARHRGTSPRQRQLNTWRWFPLPSRSGHAPPTTRQNSELGTPARSQGKKSLLPPAGTGGGHNGQRAYRRENAATPAPKEYTTTRIPALLTLTWSDRTSAGSSAAIIWLSANPRKRSKNSFARRE